jgi:hypothetical protein
LGCAGVSIDTDKTENAFVRGAARGGFEDDRLLEDLWDAVAEHVGPADPARIARATIYALVAGLDAESFEARYATG